MNAYFFAALPFAYLKAVRAIVGRVAAQTASAVAEPVMTARTALSFHQVSSSSRIRPESVAPLSAARCRASFVGFMPSIVKGAIAGRSSAVAEYSWPSSFVGAMQYYDQLPAPK